MHSVRQLLVYSMYPVHNDLSGDVILVDEIGTNNKDVVESSKITDLSAALPHKYTGASHVC